MKTNNVTMQEEQPIRWKHIQDGNIFIDYIQIVTESNKKVLVHVNHINIYKPPTQSVVNYAWQYSCYVFVFLAVRTQ